jgi:hypothetical protein
MLGNCLHQGLLLGILVENSAFIVAIKQKTPPHMRGINFFSAERGITFEYLITILTFWDRVR